MKYKNKSFLLITIMIIGLIINPARIFAGSDYIDGWSSPGTACTDGNCYEGVVGLRITIVDKNGNRCYYSNSSNYTF